MFVAGKNHILSASSITCLQSSDIENVANNLTGKTALLTPVFQTEWIARIDIVLPEPLAISAFSVHMHTAKTYSPDPAQIRFRRFSDAALLTSIDTQTLPAVPVYGGESLIPDEQDRHETIALFFDPGPQIAPSAELVQSIRISIVDHPDPLEVGMIGLYSSTNIVEGHIDGSINAINIQSQNTTKTEMSHDGGVASVQMQVIPDFSCNIVDLTPSEAATLLAISDAKNQTAPFFWAPLPDKFSRGEVYNNPEEAGGIVRLTSPVKTTLATVHNATTDDVYHCKPFNLRRWI